MIVLILLSAIVAGFALYYAVRYIKGSKKRHIAFVNVTIAVIALISMSAIFIYDSAVETDRSKYKHFDGSLVSGTHKDSDGNEYYLVTDYPGPNGDVAVAKSDTELSFMCKAIGEVRIYYSGEKEVVDLDGNTSFRLKNIVKIKPDYLGIFIWFTVITVLMLIVFNIVIAVASANRRTPKE
ncbi:MAG: hypothetical protein ILA24_04035 [Ruminococcus sp.]|nr:hypothetical protein [Ruminococcus sp.]